MKKMFFPFIIAVCMISCRAQKMTTAKLNQMTREEQLEYIQYVQSETDKKRDKYAKNWQPPKTKVASRKQVPPSKLFKKDKKKKH